MSSSTTAASAQKTEKNVWEKILPPFAVFTGLATVGSLGWAVVSLVEFLQR